MSIFLEAKVRSKDLKIKSFDRSLASKNMDVSISVISIFLEAKLRSKDLKIKSFDRSLDPKNMDIFNFLTCTDLNIPLVSLRSKSVDFLNPLASSLCALPWDQPQHNSQRSGGGDPKGIFFITEAYRAKLIFCDELMNEHMDKQTCQSKQLIRND